jgi:hypothetical protein
MEEEWKILSTSEKAKIGLYPKHGAGYWTAILMTGPLIWGAISKAGKMKAVSFSKGSFFNSVKNMSDVTPGEFKDILEKEVTLKELTLTNKNFYFLYEKGTFAKNLRAMGVPLQGAKTVKSRKNKNLELDYEVMEEGKEKPFCFWLLLSVPDADKWAKEIQNIISPPPPPPPTADYTCPYCKQPLQWIPQYQRYWCEKEKKYI